MKLLKRLLGVSLAFGLVLAMAFPQTAQAYTYTVRIYAGQQGTIVSGNGKITGQGEALVFEGLSYNDRIDFHNNMVSLKDGSKYYIKGIRQSGKGTEEISETGNSKRTASFTVTKDQDFVVAYGVLTEPVQYTIRYHNAAGQELAPSETYYGNVGDRPVIAYQYIEGYQPQAYNLTKTLSADPGENVFTFIYTPLPRDTIYTGTTTTVVSEAGPSGTTPPASSEDSEDTDSTASQQPEEDISDNSVPVAEPTPGATGFPSRPPLNEWDLDNGDVPLADFDELGLGSEEQSELSSDGQIFWNNIPLAAKIAGGVVMLGGFSVALWFLIFRRIRKEDR